MAYQAFAFAFDVFRGAFNVYFNVSFSYQMAKRNGKREKELEKEHTDGRWLWKLMRLMLRASSLWLVSKIINSCSVSKRAWIEA